MIKKYDYDYSDYNKGDTVVVYIKTIGSEADNFVQAILNMYSKDFRDVRVKKGELGRMKAMSYSIMVNELEHQSLIAILKGSIKRNHIDDLSISFEDKRNIYVMKRIKYSSYVD